ncbi:hypothetical protein [Streptomyces sp. NPDC052721]|uniref:hypothetical protein n=1 Tax=Streptomyces sp. NPDC052721 TaxID=3154955 RepID=UPI003445BCBE
MEPGERPRGTAVGECHEETGIKGSGPPRCRPPSRVLPLEAGRPLMPAQDFARLNALTKARRTGVAEYFDTWDWGGDMSGEPLFSPEVCSPGMPARASVQPSSRPHGARQSARGRTRRRAGGPGRPGAAAAARLCRPPGPRVRSRSVPWVRCAARRGRGPRSWRTPARRRESARCPPPLPTSGGTRNRPLGTEYCTRVTLGPAVP